MANKPSCGTDHLDFLEAYRVGAADDKLPQYAGITAELADVVIRVADLMGCLRGLAVEQGPISAAKKFNLAAAIEAKLAFNVTRPDHQLAKRREPGGKLF